MKPLLDATPHRDRGPFDCLLVARDAQAARPSGESRLTLLSPLGDYPRPAPLERSPDGILGGLVEDRCAPTLRLVVRGLVSVRDFVKRKTLIVRAGKKYLAKSKK